MAPKKIPFVSILFGTIALGIFFQFSGWTPLLFFQKTFAGEKSKTEGISFYPVTLPSGSTLSVEIADSMSKRSLGLMFRKNLPENQGMLFIYNKKGSYRIWMKNCFIHLDIIWLNQEKKIIEMKENAPPCQKDPCPIYGSHDDVFYILETSSGTIKRQGLSLGSIIRFQTP